MRHSPLAALALAVALVPALVVAVPRPPEPRLHPGRVSELPSFVRRVEPAIVGLRAKAPADAPSSRRLGAERFASGVIFDSRGYALTVSYILLDAVSVEVQTRDDQTVRGRVAALDLDTGLAVVKLPDDRVWPAVRLGDSNDLVAGALTGTVSVDEDNDLVSVNGSVQAIRRFAAPWEYMLDRALIVSPASESWGGSAIVNERGEVVGIGSLRLGDSPYVNLAIPVAAFLAVKDELLAAGRVVSRTPRPWLGLLTVPLEGGIAVEDVAPNGPARLAGFRKGDRIERVNGVAVRSQEEFYEALWRGRAGDTVELLVRRDNQAQVISVRSVDRASIYRPLDR